MLKPTCATTRPPASAPSTGSRSKGSRPMHRPSPGGRWQGRHRPPGLGLCIGREPFEREPVDGALAGGRVVAHVGFSIEPGHKLRVHVGKVEKRTADEAGVLDVADHALDLADMNAQLV